MDTVDMVAAGIQEGMVAQEDVEEQEAEVVDSDLAVAAVVPAAAPVVADSEVHPLQDNQVPSEDPEEQVLLAVPMLQQMQEVESFTTTSQDQ